MDSPEIVDSFMNVIVVVVFTGEGGSKEPEQCVMDLQFEDCYKYMISPLI